MKVFRVTSEWVDYDGWPISGEQQKGIFTSEEKARRFMFEQTGDPNALKYGHAKKGHDRWWCKASEVTE